MNMARGYVSLRRQAMAEQTRAAVVAAVGEELDGPLIELCERVAARAGVSAATVRKLFPRREALLAAGFDHVIETVSPPDPARASTPQAAVDTAFAYFDALGPERLWAVYRHAEESEVLRKRVRRVERAVNSIVKQLCRGDRGTTALVRTLLDPLAYRQLRLTGISAATARTQVTRAISAAIADD
jgi:AcrR family transcriptional regulator